MSGFADASSRQNATSSKIAHRIGRPRTARKLLVLTATFYSVRQLEALRGLPLDHGVEHGDLVEVRRDVVLDDSCLIPVARQAHDHGPLARAKLTTVDKQGGGVGGDHGGDGVLAGSPTSDHVQFFDLLLGRVALGDDAEESSFLRGHRQGVGGLEDGPPAVPGRTLEPRLEQERIVHGFDDGQARHSTAPARAAALLAM